MDTIKTEAKKLPNPFLSEVVKSPFHQIPNELDVPEMQSEIREKISELLKASGKWQQGENLNSLVVNAATGYGKTHLLAWTYKHCIERKYPILFLYIPPFHPQRKTFHEHVTQAVLDSIFANPEQRSLFRDALLTVISKLTTNASPKLCRVLQGKKIPSLWKVYNSFQSKNSCEVNPIAIRKVLHNKNLRQELFRLFSKQDRPTTYGKFDPDILYLLLFSIFGDQGDSILAEELLAGKKPSESNNIRIEPMNSTLQDTLNLIYTIIYSANMPFVFVFDQMEDAFSADQEDQSTAIKEDLKALYHLPHVNFIFVIQEIVWRNLSSSLDKHFYRRMTSGHGEKSLKVFTKRDARTLYQKRMEFFLWEHIPSAKANVRENPLYPFQSKDIEEAFLASQQVPAFFIREMREKYEKWLNSQTEPNHSPIESKTQASLTQAEAVKTSAVKNIPLHQKIDGKKLAKERADRKYTQRFVADNVESYPVEIFRAEKAEVKKEEIYHKLAKFYDKPLEEFFRDEFRSN